MTRCRRNWKASPWEKAGSARNVGCALRVASCELRVAGCELRVAGCELRVAGCGETARLADGILRGLFLILLCLLLSGCATAPEPAGVSTAAPRGPSSVAVWDFDNLSPTRFAQPDLGERLAAEAAEAIMRKGTWEVVERQRLLLVLEEQNLGSQAFVDESTRLRLGRMVGARTMIFGAYQSFGGDQTRIDVRLVDVETGRTVKSVDKMVPSGNFQAWYQIVQQAAEELL